MKIAVVGSGIAGLAACWYLGRQHQVTLFEKQPQIGMAAHGLSWGGARVDMPLRVLYRGYYPTLTALYAEAGVETTAADYSASFSDLDGRCYFRYANWQPWRFLSLSFPQGRQLLSRRSRQIVADLIRLYRHARRDRARLVGSGLTLQRWLDQQGYSKAFVEDFLLPTFAAIGTCRIDSVRRYPAHVVQDYLTRGVLMQGVSRTVEGADVVVKRLSSRCHELRLGTGIESIERHEESVSVRDEHGQASDFDHVILATQGNQALRLLGSAAEPGEARALARFDYEPSEVVVHTDSRLMPARRRDWSPVNFFLDPAGDRPMASIWLNAVLPVAAGTADAFQTWNPLLEVDPDKVLARAGFERPVVNDDSEQALGELTALHQQPHRRVWFCGSYAQAGVPLLESAARSALRVAEKLGG